MSAQTSYRRFGRIAVVAVPLLLGAACGQDAGSTSGATPSGGTTTASAPAPEISAACPLVDLDVIKANFSVTDPQSVETEPTKLGTATTYACDLSDGDELFLTVGVSVGPASGSAEANLRAALSGNDGEPVAGLGDVGGYHEQDGVGTAAGVLKAGSQWLVVYVHGSEGNKEALINVAKDVQAKVL